MGDNIATRENTSLSPERSDQMATKKQAAEPVEAVEAAEEAAQVEEYSWEDKREIFMPRANRGESQTLYVSVNNREFAVPLGKTHNVPYPVYEVLKRYLDSMEEADKVAEEMPNKV